VINLHACQHPEIAIELGTFPRSQNFSGCGSRIAALRSLGWPLDFNLDHFAKLHLKVTMPYKRRDLSLRHNYNVVTLIL
jgi:hypothetical protein